VARELLKRADTIVKHAQTGTTPLELARVCKAWARVTGRLLAPARVPLQHLSPIGNRRNRPPAAENAANFFPSSARAAGAGTRCASGVLCG